ncbi:flavin reductase [Hoeflea sp. TYP-13]|uniref:flavin reductase n=1 Tax=Hoeflea sp. TYP-13 TaxID=3230023 RepID=UPI0034C6CFD5
MLKRKTVQSKDYRDAMARYVGHVQLVTTEHNGIRRGVTVTAACSVSDEPPIVLVCLNKSNPNNRIFLESGNFALNTLAVQHQAMAAAFAGFENKDADERFAMGEWDTISTGCPTLTDAMAVFDCNLMEHKELATHMVLFGEVAGLRIGNVQSSLLFMDREWRSL